MSSCLALSFKRSNLVFAPEEYCRQNRGVAYQSCPAATRACAISTGAGLGLIKPFLFPAWCAINILVLPIIACVREWQGKGDGAEFLGAWAFSVLGLAAFASFMAVSAFYLPAVAGAGIFMVGVTVSIVVHVYRAAQDPTNDVL